MTGNRKYVAVCAGLCAWLTVASVIATSTKADDLVYRPINPSFGGDPFNSSHLLGIANAQNEFDNPEPFRSLSPTERFAQTIESRVLSEASREIVDRIFGENPQESGTFTVGSSEITFEQQGDQVRLTLTDLNSGGTTVLTVPTPQF